MAAATHRVVIVGGGFGGLQAALGLRRAPVEITLVDRRNFHLFQPLTYQVATGALSPGEVAYPLRAVFKRNRNVRVLLAEVARFDLERREVVLAPVAGLPAPEPVPYDTLIVAGGSRYSYFGHDEWSAHAAEVKSLESALTVRGRILAAFEAAEIERDPERRARVADVRGRRRRPDRRRDGRPDRRARPRHAPARLPRRRSRQRPHPARRGRRPRAHRVPAVAVGEGRALAAQARASRRCSAAPSSTSTRAASRSRARTARRERIPARTVVWAAGVTASGLASALAELTGAEQDRAGRVTVEADLTLPGHPEVLAIGDMVRVRGARRRGRHAPRRRAGRDAAGALRGEGRPRPPGGPRRAAVPLPATRATWPRSAAPRPSRTSRASSSAAWSPGSPGWSSTSSTSWASRTACSSSSAGRSASRRAAAARG